MKNSILVILTLCFCVSYSHASYWYYNFEQDPNTIYHAEDYTADIAYGHLAGPNGMFLDAWINNHTSTSSMNYNITKTYTTTKSYTSSDNPPTDCPTFKLELQSTTVNTQSRANADTLRTDDQSLAQETAYVAVDGGPFDLKLEKREAKSEKLAKLLNSTGTGSKQSTDGGNLEFKTTVSSPLEWLWTGTLSILSAIKSNPENAVGLEGSNSTNATFTSTYNMATQGKTNYVHASLVVSGSVVVTGRAAGNGSVNGQATCDMTVGKFDLTKL